MKCEYCGNGSGKTDVRGNCVSCGASLDKPEPVTGSWVDVIGYTCSTSASFDFILPSLYEAPPHYEPGMNLSPIREIPKTFLERVQDVLRNVWNG